MDRVECEPSMSYQGIYLSRRANNIVHEDKRLMLVSSHKGIKHAAPCIYLNRYKLVIWSSNIYAIYILSNYYLEQYKYHRIIQCWNLYTVVCNSNTGWMEFPFYVMCHTHVVTQSHAQGHAIMLLSCCALCLDPPMFHTEMPGLNLDFPRCCSLGRLLCFHHLDILMVWTILMHYWIMFYLNSGIYDVVLKCSQQWCTMYTEKYKATEITHSWSQKIRNLCMTHREEKRN